MGMDLVRQGGHWRSNRAGWSLLRGLALEHGWIPEGTAPPSWLSPAEQWDGNYSTNDGQTVSASDAQHLADALERALRDPEVIAFLRCRSEGGQDSDNCEVFVRDFVSFGRAGDFLII